MKVLVVGANGQIGRQFVQMLDKSGTHTPKAMVRRQDQVSFFNALGVETALASLEGSIDEIAEAMAGCDAVVFTAGSGGETGADKTLLVDLDGAAKTIEAAQRTGVSRFLMVSAIYADRRENWVDEMAPYYVAKHHADNILRASGLTYTIIRPGLLTNSSGTGRITASEQLGGGPIPREDVAAVLLHSLSNEHVHNKAFEVISGDDPIEEALNRL